jgi:von Willebrand factor type A domain
MRKSLRSLGAITVMAAWGMAAVGGTADAQTLTFQVPDRQPKPPVSTVRITLETGSNPTGATLTIGSDTLTLPEFKVLANGDSVDFSRVGATNTAQILWTFESNMAAAGNYCTVKPGASFPVVEGVTSYQERSMTLSGLAAVSGYRLTSYTTLSAFECQCAAGRRIQYKPVKWKTGFTPAGTDKGRHGLDVILVLDRSGSMSSKASGAPPGSDSKMKLLQWAVSQFVTTWKSEVSQVPDDRLGVVWFESSASIGSTLVRRDQAGGWDNIVTAVNNQTTAGSTALGDGVSTAIKMWRDDAKNDPTIVLMTNGMQNSGNQIKPGTQVGLGSPDLACFDLTAMPNAYALLRSQCVPVQTIGVGAAATYQDGLLKDIADQTGAKSEQNAVGNTIDLTFLNTLVSALKGNTMSILGQLEATLPSGQTTSSPAPFELDGSVPQGIVVLAWRRPGANLGLVIRDPNGTIVTPATKFDDPFYTIQSVRLPTSGPPGTWTATVTMPVIEEPHGPSPGDRGPAIPAGQAPPATPYHLSFYAVEGRLAYSLNLGGTVRRAGDPLRLEVEIVQDGVPLPNMDKKIIAHPLLPPGALGNVLHDQIVPGSVLTSDPPGFNGESPSANNNRYQRKLHHLLETTNLFSQITPQQAPQPLVFRDDGGGGDVRASDGIYTARLTSTATPGQYAFNVAIEFDDPTMGKIRRKEKLETELFILADPDNTTMTVAGDPAGTTRTLTVEPRSQSGFFLGPGFADVIHINLAGGGTVSSVVDPQETGRYVYTISGVTPNTDPDITVTVDGEEIYDGPLSGVGRPRRGAVFFGLGFNVPHGTLASTANSGFSLQAGTEFMLTKQFSIEGVFGYDRFRGSANEQSVTSLSARAKAYLTTANPRLAAFVGVGWYLPDPGDPEFGTSYGGVAEFRLTPEWSVDATYTFHNVNTPGSATRFSALHGGLRLRF